jgi:DnaJ family protein B protein 11
VQGDENEKKAAADKFAEVSHAYEVLTDPEKRKIYDRYGEEGLNNMGQGGHAHPGDIFSQFFGGFGGFPFGGGFQEEQTPKGQDVHVGVDVTLEDLYVGKEVHVTRDKHVLKPAPGKRECNCKQKMITRQIGPGMFQQTPIRECEKCDNVRLERQKDELTVHVEPGMADGQEIVFFEEGEPIVDGEQGDLVFHVQVRPHAVFDRRGADLVMTLGVTLTEALTGFEKKLRHLDGHEVVLARADVTRPGDVMVVEGEGMPVSGGAGKGRLFVHVQVRFPDKPLDAKEVGEVRRLFDVEERAWGAVQSVVEGKDVVYPEESPEKKKDEL